MHGERETNDNELKVSTHMGRTRRGKNGKRGERTPRPWRVTKNKLHFGQRKVSLLRAASYVVLPFGILFDELPFFVVLDDMAGCARAAVGRRRLRRRRRVRRRVGVLGCWAGAWLEHPPPPVAGGGLYTVRDGGGYARLITRLARNGGRHVNVCEPRRLKRRQGGDRRRQKETGPAARDFHRAGGVVRVKRACGALWVARSANSRRPTGLRKRQRGVSLGPLRKRATS